MKHFIQRAAMRAILPKTPVVARNGVGKGWLEVGYWLSFSITGLEWGGIFGMLIPSCKKQL